MTEKNSSKPPPETPVRGGGGADLRQPEHTGNPDWGYWAKLSEVKVWEALELLDGREPAEHVSEIDTDDKSYQRRLRLLLDAMSNREWFSPATLNMGSPLLHGVRLGELGRWAKDNGMTLPKSFPVAPPRIPWEFWKARKSVKLWEACMLSVGLDPDHAQQTGNGWQVGAHADPMFKAGTFPSPELEKAYGRRLILLKDHRDSPEHFTPMARGEWAIASRADHPVSLAEFAAWAKSAGLTPLPPELEELARAPSLQALGVVPDREKLTALNASMPSAAPDWSFWASVPRLPLWMAVALSVGRNPGPYGDNPHTDAIRDRARAGKLFGPEFCNRLDLGLANLSTEGPLFPEGPLAGGDLQNPKTPVSMRGFIGFARSLPVPWTLPEQMAAIIALSTPAAKQETREEREDRRLRMCEDAGLTMPKSELGRMPDGIGALAKEEGCTRQFFTDDVKAALKRRTVAQKQGKG